MFSVKCEEHLIKFNDMHNTLKPAIFINETYNDLNENIAVF